MLLGNKELPGQQIQRNILSIILGDILVDLFGNRRFRFLLLKLLSHISLSAFQPVEYFLQVSIQLQRIHGFE